MTNTLIASECDGSSNCPSATHIHGCYSDRGHNHIPVKVYERSWWNWFHKTYTVRCWKCPIEIPKEQSMIPAQAVEAAARKALRRKVLKGTYNDE